MKLLPGENGNKSNQALTPAGFFEAAARNWSGEVIDEDPDNPSITGWLIGNLCVKVVEVNGKQVKVRISLLHPETKEELAIAWEGWSTIGGKIIFENPPEGAFIVGQRVVHRMDR